MPGCPSESRVAGGQLGTTRRLGEESKEGHSGPSAQDQEAGGELHAQSAQGKSSGLWPWGVPWLCGCLLASSLTAGL